MYDLVLARQRVVREAERRRAAEDLLRLQRRLDHEALAGGAEQRRGVAPTSGKAPEEDVQCRRPVADAVGPAVDGSRWRAPPAAHVLEDASVVARCDRRAVPTI